MRRQLLHPVPQLFAVIWVTFDCDDCYRWKAGRAWLGRARRRPGRGKKAPRRVRGQLFHTGKREEPR
jgi:hypothetical protein